MSHFFPEQKVQMFDKSNFTINNGSDILLNDKRLVMMLFIDDTHTSNKLADIWNILATKIPGVIYGICNEKISINTNYKCPYILIFKNGNYIGNYIGVYSKINLIEYSNSLLNNVSE